MDNKFQRRCDNLIDVFHICIETIQLVSHIHESLLSNNLLKEKNDDKDK
ncbi:MAG: hypothetical protein HFJ17_05525 [Clostridia bacterium]|nr:hypothetical protein [Clostridia bacterium]